MLSDKQGLDAILAILSGETWDSETIELVGHIVRATGREFDDVKPKKEDISAEIITELVITCRDDEDVLNAAERAVMEASKKPYKHPVYLQAFGVKIRVYPDEKPRNVIHRISLKAFR